MNTKNIILLAGATLLGSTLSASLINFQSGAGVTALQSDGVSTLSSAGAGAYTFAFGTFNEAALSGAASTWQAAFDDQMASTNNWLLSPPPLANRFLGEVSMNDATANGLAGYIFGYNTSDSSEVIVFKNAAWTFPAFNALDTTADVFSLQDANTQVLGSGGTFSAFSGSFTMISTATVPEPSAFAAIAGVLALGFVALRRRRA